MAIVSSYGALTAIAAAPPALLQTSVRPSGPFYDGFSRTYAQIYQTQPAVRTVVDFFSRNIAQLGIHTFRRLDEVDRQRLSTHPLAQVLKRPNPSTTRYRLIESTVQDIGVYANGYWLKVRTPQRLGLVRLPASELRVTGTLMPTAYEWTPGGSAAPRTFAPSEIVHFRLYDPTNASVGFPPLETLRRVLAEEVAAAEYRQYFWKNAARIESVIERPATAPPWNPTQRDTFRAAWQQFAGSKAGMTPVLEDGMTLKPFGFNAKDSQFLETRKLSREEVAAAYHVPLPMVGILDHATFSNIREQHKQLYQDCLGPWLVMLEEDLELQLLPEFDDVEDVYLEFNIAEKMKGSFEEQANSLQTMVGRPVMSVNEGRARLNLPRDPDPESDQIARNLNQTTAAGRPRRDPEQAHAVLSAFAARQQARLDKQDPETRAEQYDEARWTRELTQDLEPLVGAERAGRCARVISAATRDRLAAGEPAWTGARVADLAAELCVVR